MNVNVNPDVAENAPAGTVVAWLVEVEPEEGASITDMVAIDATTGQPSTLFEIVGNEVRLREGATLDYESADAHPITVRFTYSDGWVQNVSARIEVQDIDEAAVVEADEEARAQAEAEAAAQAEAEARALAEAQAEARSEAQPEAEGRGQAPPLVDAPALKLAPNLTLTSEPSRLVDPTPVAMSGDTQVNTTTTFIQQYSTVAALPDGGYVVTWQSQIHDGIVLQRYDASGTPVGGEVQVNSTTASHQMRASIAVLADGGYVVTWSSWYQDGSGTGVYAQRFDAGGATVGGEVRVNTYTAGNQDMSSVAALADGGYVVTWMSDNQDGSGPDIFAQRYDADGAAVGGEERVNTHTNSSQFHSSVAALADGGYVVTWSSWYQDGSGTGIFAQRFNEDGAAVGGEMRVNTYITGSQLIPSVAALPDGGYVVTWTSDGQDGSHYGVYAQLFDSSGGAVGGEVRVNTHTNSSQGYSSVTALADGGYVVTWSSHMQDGSGWGVYGQRVDASGALVGSEFRLNDGTAGSQFSQGELHGGPATAVLADGRIVSVWDDETKGEVVHRLFSVPSLLADSLEDQPLPIRLSASLANTDGSETLTLVLSGFPEGASFSLGASGENGTWVIADDQIAELSTLTMTPPQDWNGRFTLQVVARATGTASGESTESTALVELVIAAVNDGLVAVDDIAQVAEDSSTLINVLANDSDPDGTAFWIKAGSVVSQQGTAVIEDGQIRFTPKANYSGEATITYTISDGQLERTATMRMEVTPTADAPKLIVLQSTPVPLSGDQQVNTSTSYGQQNASVAALPDGGYVVTWSSYYQDGDGWGIYAQRYGADGAAVGGELRVNTTTAKDQLYSSVAALSDGGYVVTWSSYGQDGGSRYDDWYYDDYPSGEGTDSSGIYAQRFGADGTVVGGEVRINTTTTSGQDYSSVAALSNGGYVVTWTSWDQDGSGTGIYAQRYDASGAAVDGEVRVSTYTAYDQSHSSVAALPDGGFVVTWTSHGQDGGEWGGGIYAQRFGADGAAVGSEVRVNTTVISGQDYPSVAALPDGGYVVTWTSWSKDGTDTGIFAQRFDSSGAPAGGEMQVESATAFYQLYSSVAALPDGGFVVTWTSYGQDGSERWSGGIYGQRFDSAGQAIGSEFRLNDGTAGSQNSYGELYGGQATAVLADGRIVSVWDEGAKIEHRLFEAPPLRVDGLEDQPLPIRLSASLVDTDGSETLTLVLSGYPEGASFSLGAAGENGTWVIPNAQGLDLSGLTMLPPQDWTGAFTLQVVARATETATGHSADTTTSVEIVVAEGPTPGTVPPPVLDNSSVEENSVGSTLVGVLSAGGAEAGYTFELLDDAGGLFEIANGNEIVVVDGAVLDFESGPSRQITVRVWSADGLSHTDQTFTIELADLNEEPSSLELSGGTVKENSAEGTVVGVLSATDPDTGDELTYTLVDDADGLFVLVGNEIRVAPGAEFDFETADSHVITVEVTDAGGLMRSEIFTIAVENANEEPDSFLIDGGDVEENAPAGTLVATLAATDPDGDELSYSLEGEWAHLFVVDGNEIRVADAVELDYESGQISFDLTVVATDGGYTRRESLTINVLNVEEAPTDIQLEGGEVEEGAEAGTTVATLTATDPDGEGGLVFELADDAGGLFEIDGDRIVVAAGAVLDYETQASYSVTVVVTDESGHFFEKTFDIAVTDANEAPTDITVEGGRIEENKPAGTVVATLEAVDGDADEEFTFDIDDPSGFFAIMGNQVVVAEGAQIDYETATSHTVTLFVTDRSGNPYEEELEIQVENVSGYIVGNANANTLVGTREEDQIWGRGGNDTLSGLEGDDLLHGEAGNDRLTGGAGFDTLTGGLNDDTYVLTAEDALEDTIVEEVAQGLDTVEVEGDYTLGANLERLVLTRVGDFAGTGNALANTLTGNSGHNTLDGGAGADTMAGREGDDIYYVDDVGDRTNELSGGGTDEIRTTLASLNVALNGMNYVENLTYEGTGSFSGTGNTLANILAGGSGSDTLSGASGNDTLVGNDGADSLDGGTGSDVMVGGQGNDTYTVDALGDQVIEETGGGTDTVRSAITLTLAEAWRTFSCSGPAISTAPATSWPTS
jgi:Ca2+-binding RTX toxin-like protein/predicted  nucleic acid-binding Zn-ribbon protein